MKKIIENNVAFGVSFIGIIGGSIWAYKSNYEYEPLILVALSCAEFFGYLYLVFFGQQENLQPQIANTNNQNVDVTVNIDSRESLETASQSSYKPQRHLVVEEYKPKTHILFIDDDTKFNTVKIFKDSGWKNTKTVKDIKSIDLPQVQQSDIIFVDINGVGRLLQLEFEGLDLAQMIKEKYSEKMVVIYSAKKNTNAFHRAWDLIDGRIEKNALPNQFQNMVENFCLKKEMSQK